MWKIDIYTGLFSDQYIQSLGEFETKDLAFMALKEFARNAVDGVIHNTMA